MPCRSVAPQKNKQKTRHGTERNISLSVHTEDTGHGTRDRSLYQQYYVSRSQTMSTRVIPIDNTQRMLPLTREKRTRHDTAWIVHDLKSGTLLLTQKLKHAVEFANLHLAQAGRERVSLQSLYEAADTRGNRVDGCHKMRFRITRSSLHTAHHDFDRARSQPGVNTAVIVTVTPSCYVIAKASFTKE